jgi:hypothetical protein
VARHTRTGVVVVVLALATACGLLPARGANDLAGQVVVLDAAIRAAGTPCAGARPFLYIHPGATVVVRDLEGTVLAEGRIGEGEAVNAHEPLAHLARAPAFCRMEFTVPRVPPADGYELQFGDGHTVTLDPAELEADGWYVLVTVP